MKSIIILIFSCMFITCNKEQKQLSIDDLGKYIKDPKNGLVKSYDQNATKVQASYKPSDFFIAREIGKNDSSVQGIPIDYNKYLYFTVSISKNNNELEAYLYWNTDDFSK